MSAFQVEPTPLRIPCGRLQGQKLRCFPERSNGHAALQLNPTQSSCSILDRVLSRSLQQVVPRAPNALELRNMAETGTASNYHLRCLPEFVPISGFGVVTLLVCQIFLRVGGS